MRKIVRINNFLDKVDIRDLLLNIWKVCDDSDIDFVEKFILDNILVIKEYWLLHFDLRFSQVLINLEYIPYILGVWYNYEEDEILKMQGYLPRDYIFWGSIYDDKGNTLSETSYKLIKDLDINHMQKLIDGDWIGNYFTFKIINEELVRKLRKNKLTVINNI